MTRRPITLRIGDPILSADGERVVGYVGAAVQLQNGANSFSWHVMPATLPIGEFDPSEPEPTYTCTIRLAFGPGPVQVWRLDTHLPVEHHDEALRACGWIEPTPATDWERILDATRVILQGHLREPKVRDVVGFRSIDGLHDLQRYAEAVVNRERDRGR